MSSTGIQALTDTTNMLSLLCTHHPEGGNDLLVSGSELFSLLTQIRLSIYIPHRPWPACSAPWGQDSYW